MFYPERCDLCGDCLVKCQWMAADLETGKQWMQQMMDGLRTPAVDQCITCYACNEYCPNDANPFDLIARLQEKYQVVAPEKVLQMEQQFLFEGELRSLAPAERMMSICVFGNTDAHLIEGELYDLPKLGGRPYFCWIMMSHAGGESIQRKHAKTFVDRLAASGAREIVCFHDDCYAMLAKIAPEYGIEVPFRPVHLAEYLVEYLSKNKERLRPLDLDLAYQRPCASRHTPEKEHFIDELFELVGARRVERVFDRENAMCCAGVKMILGKGDPRPDQEKNINDAKQAGAEALVSLCPMCLHSLHATAKDMDMPLIFLGDLARFALGEKSFPGS